MAGQLKVSSAEIERRCADLAAVKAALAKRQQLAMSFGGASAAPAPSGMTLDVLTDRFQVVATCKVLADGKPVWTYLLDREALHAARDGGAIITAQARIADGEYELRAKRCRWRGARAIIV